jgi:hypothetical protein
MFIRLWVRVFLFTYLLQSRPELRKGYPRFRARL